MLMEIQTWLQKPKVWRFVCFVSSVTGLLCYALSSSFNYLFGKWTCWKILLYITFSFIICLAVLFGKAWGRSTSPRLESHTAFLILLITSVYSFFFDKEVKGKPDAYGLVSCAAFAIMSLGLSRLSPLGFEVDLLYFFSGVLTVQLMKINLWLVIVGGSFSYSLILLRSTLNSLPKSEYLGLQIEDQIVIEIDPDPHETSNDSPQAIITGTDNSYVMNTITVTRAHSQESNSVMARFMGCIEALEKENGNLIDSISRQVDEYLKANVINQIPEPEIHADDNLVVDALPPGIVDDLRETARLMMTAGFEEECCRAYSRCRREFLKESLWTFGLQVQELNMEDTDKIRCWIRKVLHVVDTILFPNERRLCDRVFGGAFRSADIAFTEVCRELSISLLRIANHLATFPEGKDFTYYTAGDLHPFILELIHKIHRVSISINRDSNSILLPCVQVAKINITELLENILEANSKNHNNPTLGYVFIINNRSFIELEAKMYHLRPILGNDWLRRNTTKLQQNLELYHRSSWNKIVDFLKLDIDESEPDVAAELMKNKLHSFNHHFDETCNVQSTWCVFDDQLKEQIIKSIENILLPAYGNFLGRFQYLLGKHAYEYIKYGMFDVQDRLNNLFRVRKPKGVKEILKSA